MSQQQSERRNAMNRTYDPYKAVNDVIRGVVAAGGHPHLAEADVELAHRGAVMVLAAIGVLPAQSDRRQEPTESPTRPSAIRQNARRRQRPNRRKPHLDVQRWIEEFEQQYHRLPYGREVGGRFGRSQRWGQIEVRAYRKVRSSQSLGPTELWH